MILNLPPPNNDGLLLVLHDLKIWLIWENLGYHGELWMGIHLSKPMGFWKNQVGSCVVRYWAMVETHHLTTSFISLFLTQLLRKSLILCQIRSLLCLKPFNGFPRHFKEKLKSQQWPTRPSYDLGLSYIFYLIWNHFSLSLCSSHTVFLAVLWIYQ